MRNLRESLLLPGVANDSALYMQAHSFLGWTATRTSATAVVDR